MEIKDSLCRTGVVSILCHPPWTPSKEIRCCPCISCSLSFLQYGDAWGQTAKCLLFFTALQAILFVLTKWNRSWRKPRHGAVPPAGRSRTTSSPARRNRPRRSRDRPVTAKQKRRRTCHCETEAKTDRHLQSFACDPSNWNFRHLKAIFQSNNSQPDLINTGTRLKAVGRPEYRGESNTSQSAPCSRPMVPACSQSPWRNSKL